MSKSLLKQCHDKGIPYEPVYRIAANGMCTSNCTPVKKPWISSNNDPLQDYIRRTLAGKVMCRSNESMPIVYSTLSKEKVDQMTRRPVQKHTYSSNETTPRRYFITSTPAKPNQIGYHPYLEQKRVKYVVINRNGLEQVKSQADSSQFEGKEELENKLSLTNRLDFIERYISHNTNRSGYVPLNETILKELGTAIIECLSRKVTVTSSKVTRETLYEPISPAGCSEDDD